MKKLLLILSSIVLLFLINACTPLPTGGPVSSNVIYKVQNKKGTLAPSGQPTNRYDSLPIEINNDNVNDFYLIRDNSAPLAIWIAPANNTKFATVTVGLTGIKQYALSESINSSNNWQSISIALMQGSYDGTSVTGVLGTYIYGLQIKNGSNFNYAWIKLDCNALTKVVTVIESAYNTTPNQAILAGKK